jgi:phosphohistidine phosphatase
MRRLYLLRHAKSDWADQGLDDHDRPLAPRGVKACATIGDALRRRDVRLDKVLVSSAKRAVDTWGLVRQRLERPPVAETDGQLYLCGAGKLLAVAQATDDAVAALMIVAHNPDLQRLASLLAGPSIPPEAAPALMKFPTGALACIELPDGGWAALSGGGTRLAWLVTPKSLEA